MYLSGSVKEFRNILLAAADLKANAIHFISPNNVFILAGNKKDYVYAKTKIIIGQSILLPKTSYSNMHLYIKGTKKAYSNPASPFYLVRISTIMFTPGKVSFNHSDSLSLEADIPALPLKRTVIAKIQEAMQSSFDLESPFLNIHSEQAEAIHSALLKNKRRYFDKARKSEDNAIRIEKEQLIIHSRHDGKPLTMDPEISDFSVSELFRSTPFVFSDKAFYLYRWMAQAAPVEEVIILPRKNYCLIEGHARDLTIKVRTSIRSDLDLKNV